MQMHINTKGTYGHHKAEVPGDYRNCKAWLEKKIPNTNMYGTK